MNIPGFSRNHRTLLAFFFVDGEDYNERAERLRQCVGGPGGGKDSAIKCDIISIHPGASAPAGGIHAGFKPNPTNNSTTVPTLDEVRAFAVENGYTQLLISVPPVA